MDYSWLPTRNDFLQLEPDFTDAAQNAYYQVHRTAKADSILVANSRRQSEPLGARLLWCVTHPGIVRVNLRTDEKEQVVMGTEARSGRIVPRPYQECTLRDRNGRTYSGQAGHVWFRPTNTVGLVVLFPFREIICTSHGW